LQLSGGQLEPPPLQTEINAKILKISPEWRRILIDEFFLYLFVEFEVHPSNSFRENRKSHKFSFLNMIGAKLSDQRNSRNAGRFKSTNQRLAYCGSPPRFSRRSNPPEEAKHLRFCTFPAQFGDETAETTKSSKICFACWITV